METIRSPRSRDIYNASRLTKIYAQHKAATPPVSAHDAPEVLSLHRKFRIQKDRLIAWGFEWADANDSEQTNIDEALARAGLTELVSSIMNNIQHITEEIEQLGSEPIYTPGVYRPDSKYPLPRRARTAAWTKAETAQYEDLVKDYTKAIDLLCDLPRSRRPVQEGKGDGLSQMSWSHNQSSDHWSADLTLVDHEVFKLHISSLVIPEESPPSYDDLGAVRCTRIFGHLRHSHVTFDSYSKQKESLPQPVLIEYANFDSIYKENNIPVPMSRLEQLYMHLQSRDATTEKTLTKLLGYFEDPHQPRYGLVFALPEDVAENLPAMSRIYNSIPHTSLLDLLQTSSRLHAAPHPSAVLVVPPLEERFRLAHELVSGLSFLHERSFAHHDISSNSITLLPKMQSTPNNSTTPQYDLRRPLLGAFDLFSEFTIDPKPFEIHQNLYRHPEDPKVKGTAATEEFQPRFDLYSLGLVLLEIGLWSPVADTFKEKYSLSAFRTRIEKIWVRKLAGKCGSVYMRAVQDCLIASSNPANGADKIRQIYGRVKLRLARCCVVDDSDLDDVPDTAPLDHRDSEVEVAPPSYTKPVTQRPQVSKVAAPNVFWEKRLPESVENYWQSELAETVGEIVDRALKTSKESMMLGLAYTGENEASAKLTILVGCESIEPVTAALQRDLLVDRNVFDIVVHSGQVVWSKAPRNGEATVKRSAGLGYEAKNPHHQIKPVCGASIGAWRNNEHMPPVTFGGVVMVDGERYGLSVHHMLEDAEEDSDDESKIVRSASNRHARPPQPSTSKPTPQSLQKGNDALEESMTRLTVKPTQQLLEEGDTTGVVRGTERIYVTQPALDDVADKEDFFPVPEDMDEDHLDSHTFGTVYASSGLRRTTHQGLKQEVDWVLIKISDGRAQPRNVIPGGKRHLAPVGGETPQPTNPINTSEQDHSPQRIANSRELKGLPVHCVGRTSGLGTGKIAATLWQVRFPGRSKRSWAWVVTGGIGLPGDSGAWLVDNKQGRVCGHILGYIGEYDVALFSPMDLTLEDIKTTLNASEVCLPGGAANTVATQLEAGAMERGIRTLARPSSFMTSPAAAARSAAAESSQGIELGSMGSKLASRILASGNTGPLEREWGSPKTAIGQRTLLGQRASG